VEKVVFIYSHEYLWPHQANDVNKYLDQGYTVKNITTIQEKGYITVIFVLEKI
jgi:hypothetical protein